MTQIYTDDYALLLKGKVGSRMKGDIGGLFLLGEFVREDAYDKYRFLLLIG